MKYINHYEATFFEKGKNIHEELKKNYWENLFAKDIFSEYVYDIGEGIVVSQSDSKKYGMPIGIIGDVNGRVKSELEQKFKCMLKEINFEE